MDSWEKMYSVKEVSAITGWSSDTIRRLVYRGELKAAMLPRQAHRRRRIYRSVRIAENALKDFLQRNQN